VSSLDRVLLLVFTLALAGGQLLFKRAADGVAGAQGAADAAGRVALSPSFYLALCLYGGSTLLWIWILTRVPLSQAYPWAAAGTALVPLLAVLLFGEQVRPLYWLGIALIMAGIIVVQRAFG
jgi:multidrug transporter EmrE-like cation transporter